MILNKLHLWFTSAEEAVARRLRRGSPIATPTSEQDKTEEYETLVHDLVEQHLTWLADSEYVTREFDKDAYRSYLLNYGKPRH